MIDKKDWATKCLQTTFRPAFEKLVEEIQRDASNWNQDDHRMWKEQCRIGDVAFQHLFCVSKGKPLPDWVTADLPKVYNALNRIKELEEEIDYLSRELAVRPNVT